MDNNLFSAERLTKEIIAMQLLPQDTRSSAEPIRLNEAVEDALEVFDQAVKMESPALFADYVRWYEVLQQSRNVENSPTGSIITALQSVLSQEQAADIYQQLQPYLEEASGALIDGGQASFIMEHQPYAAEANVYLNTVIRGKRRETIALLNQFVQSAIPVKDLYLFIFQPVQREVGRLWHLNQIGIPEEHFATNLTRMAMAQLAPMVVSGASNGYRVLAASVGRELHDLGLRMVADFFEMAGWDCYYLGANTPLAAIVQGVKTQHPHVLALSATISTQLNQVAEVIRQVRIAADVDLKILVGGYPFNVAPTVWEQVGADGFAQDAETAVQQGNQWVWRGDSQERTNSG